MAYQMVRIPPMTLSESEGHLYCYGWWNVSHCPSASAELLDVIFLFYVVFYIFAVQMLIFLLIHTVHVSHCSCIFVIISDF